MKKTKYAILSAILITLSSFLWLKNSQNEIDESGLLSHIINPQRQEIQFYWKDTNENVYGNFQDLKLSLEKENKELVFAMNGGMYKKDQSPQGLYIENGLTLTKIDTAKQGYGNFYMQPNGIFYLTNDNKPVICATADFKYDKNIKYATQSGPMLVIDGKIHTKFKKGSVNLNIRNGVGILPDGNLLFAMSKEEINFYDFASYFLQKGCKNALYLDGFISRVYLPSENWIQLESNFGVIIGETRPIN